MSHIRIPPIEETLFAIAERAALHATCPRRSVGCVLVKNFQDVISIGYNSSPDGMPICLTSDCIIEGGHCVRVVHAEMWAILSAVRNGISLIGATAYCTLLPCINCMQSLYLAGVTRIVYDESYDRDEKNHLFQLAELAGIMLVERTCR